jgi:hypothetical protein
MVFGTIRRGSNPRRAILVQTTASFEAFQEQGKDIRGLVTWTSIALTAGLHRPLALVAGSLQAARRTGSLQAAAEATYHCASIRSTMRAARRVADSC